MPATISTDDDGTIIISIPPDEFPIAEMIARALRKPAFDKSHAGSTHSHPAAPQDGTFHVTSTRPAAAFRALADTEPVTEEDALVDEAMAITDPIVEFVREHGRVSKTAIEEGLPRVHNIKKRVQALVREGVFTARGNTNNRTYETAE
jgi:hypothetical protein